MSLRSFDSNFNFNDFPDEVLLMVFEWLNSVDVLYSFHNLNTRLNRILCHPTISRRLNLVEKSLNDYNSRIRSNEILNRLCCQILPSISDQIDQFDLESFSMQQISNAAPYPNLSKLSLYNLKREGIEWLFKHEKVSCGILPNAIRKLHIRIDEKDVDESSALISYICGNVFTVFHSLINLELDESLLHIIGGLTIGENRLDHFQSSSLKKLKINVPFFEDVLYLFDGRFSQLENVHLSVFDISLFASIENESELPQMKHFSISCDRDARFETALLPLLKRMSNLEQLKLCLKISLSQGFVNLNYVYTNIVCLFPKLKQLAFYICSRRRFPSEVDLSILQRLGEVFTVSPNVGITAHGDYFPEAKHGQYHFYSVPSFNEYFSGISNRFPGGIFLYVREVSLIDEKPFEDQFFLLIAQSFPRMEKLSIRNYKGPSDQSNDDQHNLSPIKYAHLIRLILVEIHDHYLERFLLNSKSDFLREVTLDVEYQSLKRLTDNFTRDRTQLNSCKVNHLYICDHYPSSNNLQQYFPYAKIH